MTQTVTLKPESKRADILKLIEVIKTFDYSKILSVKVSEDKETRRDKQNRLMWRWHGEFAKFRYESAGEIFSPEDWHEVFKKEFIGCADPVKVMGEWVIRVKSTTDLSVPEFAEMLTKYQVECAEMGLQLTSSDDLYFEAMMKGVDGG